MTTAITSSTEGVELALISGDLSKLTPVDRLAYYHQVCRSLDLNPLTKPFAYINLSGKLTLYALKDCTEQLRSKRSIGVTIVAREIVEDCYVVTARATLPSGRPDESIGAVPIAGLKGEARANAMMKAETKAKRRVTLSICGLGMLDETEVEAIPNVGYVVEAPAALQTAVAVPPAQSGGDSERPSGAEPSADAALSADTLRIVQVRQKVRGAAAEITLSTGEVFVTYKQQLGALAEEICQRAEAIETPEVKVSASGNPYIVGLKRKAIAPAPTPLTEPISADQIPF